MILVVRVATLYNTCELVDATHLATLEDMADKLVEERFCSNKISELRDCLVLQQSQLRTARLSDRAYQSCKQLEHNLVGLATRN